MKGLKRVAQVGIVALLFAAPMIVALAAIPTPSVPTAPGSEVTLGTLENLILRIITFLVTFGIIIAVGMIIFGGIRWMTAAGNEERATAAKETIWNGVKGAAIVLGVGVILRTVAALVNLDFFFN